MREDKRQWRVRAQVEFEVEAVDGREAEELVSQYVGAEFAGEQSGLGVRFRSIEDIEGRLM